MFSQEVLSTRNVNAVRTQTNLVTGASIYMCWRDKHTLDYVFEYMCVHYHKTELSMKRKNMTWVSITECTCFTKKPVSPGNRGQIFHFYTSLSLSHSLFLSVLCHNSILAKNGHECF
jgi:hypothetical protein